MNDLKYVVEYYALTSCLSTDSDPEYDMTHYDLCGRYFAEDYVGELHLVGGFEDDGLLRSLLYCLTGEFHA